MQSSLLQRFLFSCVGFCYLCHSQATEVIQLETDIWCPYTCDEKNLGMKGYVVDVAEAIFQEHNIKLVSTVAPWARLMFRAEKGDIDAMGAAYKEGREDKFIYPTEDFGKSINSFYVRRSSKWEYKTPASLKDITLGSILGYVYAGHINELRSNAKKLVEAGGETAFQKNLEKLVKNELDAVIEEQTVANYTINLLAFDKKVREAGTIGKKTGIYIAFTKNRPTSKRYVSILEEGLRKYRKNGKFEKILKKYGLKMEK